MPRARPRYRPADGNERTIQPDRVSRSPLISIRLYAFAACLTFAHAG